MKKFLLSIVMIMALMPLTVKADGTETKEGLLPPTNLRSIVEQDVPGYNYKYRVTMMWDAVEGVDYYNVYVNTEKATDFYVGLSNGTAYIIGSASEGTIEFYVKSVLGEDESEASEKCTVIIEDNAVEEITPSFNVYPNPVQDKLFLATELNVKEVSIYDIYGKETKVCNLQSADFVNAVDVAELNSGVYFISIKTDNGNIVRRFVKD